MSVLGYLHYVPVGSARPLRLGSAFDSFAPHAQFALAGSSFHSLFAFGYLHYVPVVSVQPFSLSAFQRFSFTPIFYQPHSGDRAGRTTVFLPHSFRSVLSVNSVGH
jgi:hypothetical protein